MKTNRKPKSSLVDNQLYNLFKNIYEDNEEIDSAVRDAKKAFSLVQKDAVYKETSSRYEP